MRFVQTRHPTADDPGNATERDMDEESDVATHSLCPPAGVWKAYGERCVPLLDESCDIGLIYVQEGLCESKVCEEPLGAHRLILLQLWTKARSLLTRRTNPEWGKISSRGAWWRDDFLEVEAQPISVPVELVDLSGVWWATEYLLRKMIRFSYGQTIIVEYSSLPSLSAAAREVGFGELVKVCSQKAPCDRIDKPILHGPPVPQATSTNNGAAVGEDTNTEEPRGNEPARVELDRNDSGSRITSTKQVLSNLKHSFLEDEPTKEGLDGDDDKPKKKRIRRVLSDLKRNIVESSRVICNASFHEKYEMIMTDRGILGEGINGPVRMAVHRETGKEVAVKRISMMNLSEQRKQMLLSEVRIFLQVNHANIVRLHEVYESDEDQAVLLVMELCTGRELFERLSKREYYSELDATIVAKQMIDAVCYLHSHNICHRDLKLENWLYEDPKDDAKLKLCDFGFGQVVEPSVQLTATLGSLYYVAPEVLAGSYGLMCDMWSIGVIVYMLLSGAPPFDGETDEEIIANVRKGKFNTSGKRWQLISDPAKHFVHSLLRKDPYERLSAAEAQHHSWLREVTCLPVELSVKQRYRVDLGLPKDKVDQQLQKTRAIDQSVVKNMRRLAINNAIKRAALALFSQTGRGRDEKRDSSEYRIGSEEEDVQHLLQQFQLYDEKKTGKIDIDDFTTILKETLQSNSREARLVFDTISGSFPREEAENQNGTGDDAHIGDVVEPMQLAQIKRDIDYGEFLTATIARRTALNTAVIREAFRLFDTEGKGFITLDGLRNLLNDEIDTTSLEDVLRQCNVDVNGMIDYNDFSDLFLRDQNAAANAIENIALGKVTVAAKGDVKADVKGYVSVNLVPWAARLDTPETEDVSSEAEPSEKAWPTETRWVPSDEDEHVKKTEDGDDHEDDRNIQSDEEQLVTEDTAPSVSPREVSPPQNVKEPRFAPSFSLSLAGSAEYDDVPSVGHAIHRVISMPSDVYTIKQLAGFHSKILRPFYANQPVSNVVMGLIRGTSLYAMQAASHRLTNIIHTNCGWFFIMPNPKYHQSVTASKTLISKDGGKFRFVAWWIHTQFQQQLRHWFDRITYEGMDEDMHERRREHARREEESKKLRGTSKKWGRDPATQKGDKSRDTNAQGRDRDPRDRDRDKARDRERERQRDKEKACAKATEAAKQGLAIPVGDDDTKADIIETGGTPPQKIDEEEVECVAANGGNARSIGSDKTPPDGEANKTGNGSRQHDSARAYTKKERRKPNTKGEDDYGERDTDIGVGNPGDFQFSNVPKPEGYLHTYRDLHKEHVVMLKQLQEGVRGFLRGLFDDSFLQHSNISAGFHYPVRTQYSTLHLQVRINSGSVCREDGRGVTIESLITTMEKDPLCFIRDEGPLRYKVTENVKVSLLTAATQFNESWDYYREVEKFGCSQFEVVRELAPLRYELGIPAMPTIEDKDEEDEERFQYIINLQPHAGSPGAQLMLERNTIAKEYGLDSTYLYPPHVSVTGFFECTEQDADAIADLLMKMAERKLSEQLVRRSVSSPAMMDKGEKGVTPAPQGKLRYKNNVASLPAKLIPKSAKDSRESLFKVRRCILTPTNYVLLDVACPIVKMFAEEFAQVVRTQRRITIRPKAVSHISLAANRDHEILAAIRSHYASAWSRISRETDGKVMADVDIVMAKLDKRGTAENSSRRNDNYKSCNMEDKNWVDFEPHLFTELVRIPLKRGWHPLLETQTTSALVDVHFPRFSSSQTVM